MTTIIVLLFIAGYTAIVFEHRLRINKASIPLCACLLVSGCAAKYEFPFQNPALQPEKRAADLVSRLTLEEKAAQMLNQTPAIERLGIPPYDWWNECLHGAARTKYKTTVFPQAIALAAGWDDEAIRLMADYTASEGRAIYNSASAKGDYDRYHGLTYWSPNINIVRDPRWGRGQETYGEDPYLSSEMGENFVRGLQGSDPRRLKAAACAKHYAVHSGPENVRHKFNAKVSDYDLWDTYLPAFKRLVVDAQVAGLMCAYNAVYGQPCCANDKLMNDILRKQWGFAGYVTSDCGAIDDFFREWGHKTHASAASAAADALVHTTDIDCGNAAYKALPKAIKEGLITEAQLDTSLERLFTIRFRLGLLDPKGKQPFADIDSTTLECAAHQELALKMARQSIVLLKNDGILPLKLTAVRKIAVVGPNANNPIAQLGNYNGFPTKIISVIEGIRAAVGSSIIVDSAVDKDADVVIYAGGLNQTFEGEDGDGGERRGIALPAEQTKEMQAIRKMGLPIVFVVMTGSAIAFPWEAENAAAIVNAWYGGQAAGAAVADVLLGTYNPSGRLPITFYAADSDLPPFDDYAMKNRTYRYFAGKTQYPFGYGLSYTKFEYSWGVKPLAAYNAGDVIKCSAIVKNTGGVNGDEVVQAYIKYPQGRGLPLKELRHFSRISAASGQKVKVEVAIPLADLAKWDADKGAFTVPAGEYSIFIGGSSADEAAAGKFEVNP